MTFEFKPRLYSTFNLKKKSICWTPFLRGSLGSQVSGKCQKNGSRIKFTISYQHNLLGQVILLLIYKKKKKKTFGTSDTLSMLDVKFMEATSI